MKEKYFSWDNIHEVADIQSHISYATDVLNKYSWESSVRDSLRRQLDAILAKQNDKMLNISVIGEFSSGKSSFINALVGCELLAVNVLQGTTVAITIIEYAGSFCITLVGADNREKVHVYKSAANLSKALVRYTTDPSFADKISMVKVGLPSDLLKRGLRIIDTPGTNSLEQWHEDITRRAINDISDLSIILMDASRPMPETLVGFVEETLGGGVRDCLFVANKIDLIRARERQRMMAYIGNKIDVAFGMEKSAVVPFSSVALTNDFASETVRVDDESKRLTYDSLQTIFSYTAQKRLKAQARKVLRLIDGMYANLSSNVKKVSTQYQSQLDELEKNRQADLAPFITEQLSKRHKEFMYSANSKKAEAEMITDKMVDEGVKKIFKSIDSFTASTLDSLSGYIKNGGLTGDIKAEGDGIASKVEKEFPKIKQVFSWQMSIFRNEFEHEFKRLKLLSVKFDVKPKEVAIRHVENTANIAPVTKLISEELSKENWAVGGGMAAGAAIGACFGGPVGAFIGGAIGLFAGCGAAPDSNEVKEKVKSKLEVPLKSYYRLVCADCMQNYSNYIYDVSRSLESEISRYFRMYNEEVQHRIDEWKVKYADVRMNIQKVEREISEINSRKVSITNIINNLDNQ